MGVSRSILLPTGNISFVLFSASHLNCGLQPHGLTSVTAARVRPSLASFLFPRTVASLLRVPKWSQINRESSVTSTATLRSREIAGTILSLMMFYISKNLAPFDINEWNVRCNCYCFLTFHRLIRPASGFPECGFVPKKRTGFLVKEF